MGLIHIMKRGGEDLHEYKKALKMAKKGIEMLCEISEEMEDEYGYGERGSYRMSSREDDDMYERGSMRRGR